MLRISDIAAERRGGFCLFALEKGPEVERSYKKKSVKSVYIKKVCLL